jgi:hypothetical protein
MSASAQHPGDSECLCHVIPLQDFRPHEASAGCWCGPRPLPDAPSVYVHNALDGRELIERGERAIQ